MNPSLRRTLVSSAVLPVVVALTTSVSTSPAQAAVTVDPRPAGFAGDWLAGELTDGLMHNGQYDFDDYGLSIDTAFALTAVGGHDGTVAEITDAVAANVETYVGGGADAPDEHYAGSTGKVLALATSQGRDTDDFGGVDLVAGMESLVLDEGAVVGRIADESEYGDYANTIGQAFAAQGLAAAGSASADDVTGFLLEQQCSAGFFRLGFAAVDAPDQTCDAGDADTSAPDTDVTALAVLSLLDQQSDPEVGAAIDAARDWLLDQQRGNGSYGGGPSTEAPNSNSTGLAGWVLGELGEDEAAARAAGWIRARQADEVAPCASGVTTETGAVAYDNAARKEGRADGIAEETSDQWRRATSQALPALAWAPDGAAEPELTGPYGYVKARGKPRFRLGDLAPGESVCLTRGKTHVHDFGKPNGTGGARVRMPGGTRTAHVSARTADGTRDTVTVDVLGRLDLHVSKAKRHVARRGRQTVHASGLAPHEQVRVFFRGHKIETAHAGRGGRFSHTFHVGARAGKVKVAVRGEFGGLRHGSTLFRVG